VAVEGEMYTAGRRSMQSHGLTRHIHRVKECWSARASTVVALAHSLFARSAPRNLARKSLLSALFAGLTWCHQKQRMATRCSILITGILLIAGLTGCTAV